jgi:hypothetical protein
LAAARTSGRDEPTVDRLAVLADCPAESRSEVHGGVHRHAACEAQEVNPAKQRRQIEKTRAFLALFRDEVRLAGFEPATYGLGNRCSIP